MKYIAIQFNRKAQTASELEAVLKEEFEPGEITRFAVHTIEDSSNLLIELLRDDSSKVRCDVRVFGIDPIELVARGMSEHVEQSGNRNFIAINLLPLGGQRALGVVVTAPEKAAEKKLSDGTRTKGKESKGKQNQRPDAGKDAGTEGGAVSGNAPADPSGS